jgi:hypothetical protein
VIFYEQQNTFSPYRHYHKHLAAQTFLRRDCLLLMRNQDNANINLSLSAQSIAEWRSAAIGSMNRGIHGARP